MDPALVLLATAGAMFVSSAAGYGGSLVLVPALAAVLGPREGIALAAVVLAANNLVKVVVYRRTLAVREGWPLIVVTAIGVLAGSSIVITVPETWLVVGIIAVAVLSLLIEVVGKRLLDTDFGVTKRRSAVPMMAASAVLSGASGSSGPLKGLSIRHLGLARMSHVGLASTISLTGDALKAGVFAEAGLIPGIDPLVVATAAVTMPVAAWAGWQFNRRISEGTFRWVFWGVIGGYGLRLAGVWF